MQWTGFDVVVGRNELRYVFAGSRAPADPAIMATLPMVTVLKLSPLTIVSTRDRSAKLGGAMAPILDYTEW
jgi:hypothetical protein